MNSNFKIMPISMKQANRICFKVFKEYASQYYIKKENQTADLNISKGLYVGKKLVGIYLLKPENYLSQNKKIKGNGVRGVSLAVLPEFRGRGYGKALIEYSESLPFSYIWGRHAKNLNNIHFWLKRRKMLNENSYIYETIKMLK